MGWGHPITGQFFAGNLLARARITSSPTGCSRFRSRSMHTSSGVSKFRTENRAPNSDASRAHSFRYLARRWVLSTITGRPAARAERTISRWIRVTAFSCSGDRTP